MDAFVPPSHRPEPTARSLALGRLPTGTRAAVPADRRAGADAPRPTVVLLHSSASSARQWQALAELLRADYEVRAVDLHGHGEQAPWHGRMPLSLADEAALAAPLLSTAGDVHVVGHSYGAAVGLKLAMLYPSRVCSVSVYEPVLLRWLFDDGRFAALATEFVEVADGLRDRLAFRREHEAARRFVDYWSGTGAWNLLPDGRKQAIAGRMHAVAQHFGALLRERMPRAALAALEMPMLVLSGEQTVDVTRCIGKLLRQALPQALHQTVPGADHMGPITAPAAVNERILRFLQHGVRTAPARRRQALPA